ncbi:hypothetical protein Taro_025967 [Colocasia esculenta]|uniref:Uncharacterized protein n=1 Tax=Colocasia esculenta TaxID=4460 RepID=A0A843VI46_COLES|nr:hypothetical protein [Colocasia esculenta]
MSSGRGSSATSASGPSMTPPLAVGSGQFTPPPPTVAASSPSSVPPPLAVGPSVSAPPAFLTGASTVPEEEDVEKELKRPPTFQEVFDKTHKKKGTDQYISDRAREVAESYSQQMTEKYAGEEE